LPPLGPSYGGLKRGGGFNNLWFAIYGFAYASAERKELASKVASLTPWHES
jgi:hypothetical protein